MVRTCGTNAVCHDADAPQGGLDLFSPGVASRVVDVAPGLCVTSGNYVDSADPLGASFLLEKIEAATPSCGAAMPPLPEAPLTSAEVACITAWITEITGGGGTMDGGATDSASADATGDAADAAEGGTP